MLIGSWEGRKNFGVEFFMKKKLVRVGLQETNNFFRPCHVGIRLSINASKQYFITYCKTHYYRAPFNFTHFALGDDNAYITGADIRSK